MSENPSTPEGPHLYNAVLAAYDAGTSQAQIAKLTGMSREQIHRWLRAAGRLPAHESED